ncbi:MAG: aminotransferase class I/II-fold pyridoxal phosphate-dependent enzyme [Clostridia bacterium]
MKTPESYIRQDIRDMAPSGIRKYFEMMNELEDVISLSIGEPDFVTPWQVSEAGVYALEKGHTHYSANSGMLELREQISLYLKRKYGLSYNPADEIIATVGASEAIDIALRGILEPGDEVIIPEPSFVAYKGCVTVCKGVPVVVELKEKDCFKLKADDLEKAISPRTKALILSFPNNPTGSVMTREDLREIVRVLQDREILVITDEVYGELTYGREHCSIASFPEVFEKTLYVGGFSKSHAMTGWRLGYVCGNSMMISHLSKIHQYAIMCAPIMAQYAGIEAYARCEKEVEAMVSEYDMRRRYLLKGIREAGLPCFEAEGAFYLFPNISGTKLTSDVFCQRLLREHRVLVVPGTAFGECGEGFIRMTYASSFENIKEALVRIRRFAASLREVKND